jgi:hypothetical protein
VVFFFFELFYFIFTLVVNTHLTITKLSCSQLRLWGFATPPPHLPLQSAASLFPPLPQLGLRHTLRALDVTNNAVSHMSSLAAAVSALTALEWFACDGNPCFAWETQDRERSSRAGAAGVRRAQAAPVWVAITAAPGSSSDPSSSSSSLSSPHPAGVAGSRSSAWLDSACARGAAARAATRGRFDGWNADNATGGRMALAMSAGEVTDSGEVVAPLSSSALRCRHTLLSLMPERVRDPDWSLRVLNGRAISIDERVAGYAMRPGAAKHQRRGKRSSSMIAHEETDAHDLRTRLVQASLSLTPASTHAPISRRNLRVLSPSLSALEALTDLDVSHNNISVIIKDALACIPQLTVLNISHNALPTWDGAIREISKCARLREVTMINMCRGDPPEALTGIPASVACAVFFFFFVFFFFLLFFSLHYSFACVRVYIVFADPPPFRNHILFFSMCPPLWALID